MVKMYCRVNCRGNWRISADVQKNWAFLILCTILSSQVQVMMRCPDEELQWIL